MLNRFCDAYPDDARLQEELALPGFEDSLVRVGPGYPCPLRICRLDAFLAGDQVKFLEFNADSPAGIGYTDVLHEGLRQAISLPGVDREFDTAYEPMLPLLVATLLDAYREMRAARAGAGPSCPRPRGWRWSTSPAAPRSPSSGSSAPPRPRPGSRRSTSPPTSSPTTARCCAPAASPSSSSTAGPWSTTSTEGDLTAAYRDGAACVVNPPRARVANNKKLMALLDDPRFAHLVEPREAEVIAATIPWTRVLRPGRVTYGQWTIDLLDFVSDNRARLVLKPASEYGGHGVALGMETEQGDWDRIIAEQAESGDFIVQEYVPVPEEMFPTVEDGHVQMRLKRFNINPFGIGGRYAGMITRISDQAVINVSAGRRAAAERGRPPQAAFARRGGRGSGGGARDETRA